MGSTIEAERSLIKIINAFRDGKFNVFVSTGNLSFPVDFKVPEFVRVIPNVPGLSVMTCSALAVHHAGDETLMQALAAGMPSLVVPGNVDQILLAQQIQAAGIG